MDTRENDRTVDYVMFAVDEKPHCIWGTSLVDKNAAFLAGLDPSYFTYAVGVHRDALDGEHRQKAALSIRLTYSHALETFFALIGAVIQAPHCPIGWLLRYSNSDLYSLVGKINSGESVRSRLPQPISWRTLSDTINCFSHPDNDEDLRIKSLFRDTWERLAHEFVSESCQDEYNSIKHGFRVRSGGFDFSLTPADGEAPSLQSASEFGTKAFGVEKLDRVNYGIIQVARNWSPTALAIRVELLAVSISNVISYLRCHYFPGNAAEVHFKWPEKTDALAMAWTHEFLIESLRGGVQLTLHDIEPKSALDVLGAY